MLNGESQQRIELSDTRQNEGGYDDVATQLSRIGEDGLEPIPANVVVNSLDDVTQHGISREDAARALGINL